MTTQTITITQLKSMSTTKLVALLNTSNVLVTSSGNQISLMSAIDNSYGARKYGV